MKKKQAPKHEFPYDLFPYKMEFFDARDNVKRKMYFMTEKNLESYKKRLKGNRTIKVSKRDD